MSHQECSASIHRIGDVMLLDQGHFAPTGARKAFQKNSKIGWSSLQSIQIAINESYKYLDNPLKKLQLLEFLIK